MYAITINPELNLHAPLFIIGRLRGAVGSGANLLGRRLVGAAGSGLNRAGIGGRVRSALGAAGRLAQRVGRRLGG